jgi:hypothetical protein
MPEQERPAEQGRIQQTSNFDTSFDELAKGVASGTLSRSKALRLLGAALVGGVLASIPGVAWAQPPSTAGRCRPQCPEGYTCRRFSPQQDEGSPRRFPSRGKPFFCCPDTLEGECCSAEQICPNGGECCTFGECMPNGECCPGQLTPTGECCEGTVLQNGECCEGQVMQNGECCPPEMEYCVGIDCSNGDGDCVVCDACCPAGADCVSSGTSPCPQTCGPV